MKSQKSHFCKGVNPCFWFKNASFLVYADLVKIRLEIMLTDFPQEKRNLFGLWKTEFFKVKKIACFQMGKPNAFGKKCQLFGLFRFGQNKTSNNA